MALANCGSNFYVSQKAERPVLLAVACAIFVVLLIVFGPAVLAMVPAGVWLFALAHAGRAPAPPVLVKFDRVTVGARSVALKEVHSVRVRLNRIVIHTARYTLAFDASSLDPIARVQVVRHIEARVLLARRGRCKRLERLALEAFYVLGANAVRVQKRAVLEILSPEGPWSPGRGNVYVRSLGGAATSAYRSNARTGAIEIGSLEMNLP